MGVKINWTTQEVELIVNKYQSGESITKISKQFNVSHKTIRNVLVANNIEIISQPQKIAWSIDEIEDIKDLYIKGFSTTEISKKYKCSSFSISKLLKEYGVELRKHISKNKTYTCDYDFFEVISTEEKAYWLGFLYADGCVTSKRQYNSQAVMITLNSQDIQHLKHLIHHFIRGYFDGDGSVCSNGKSNGYKVAFLGTKEFLEGVKTFLGVKTKFYKRHKNSEANNYTLSFGGNLQVLVKLNMLYENATIYLDRKYDTYKQIKQLYN